MSTTLQAQLAEARETIAEMTKERDQDTDRMERAAICIEQQTILIDTLLGEAVWAMTALKLAVEMHWAEILDEELEGQGVQVMAAKDSKWQRAQAFLARPEVRERQERKLDGYAGGSLNRELDMQDAAREEGRQKETT